MYVRSRKLGPVLPMTSDDKYSKFAKSEQRKALRAWLRVGAMAVALLFFAMCWWLSTPILKAYRTSRTPDFDSEMYFKTPEGALEPFPSLHDPATVTVSVVVPAYNEEERMPAALEEMTQHLVDLEDAALAAVRSEQGGEDGDASAEEGEIDVSPFSWEIIIVDDGSKDGTAALAAEWSRRHGSDRIRLLKLHQNSGKGAAVRKGFMRARGEYVLMADADGATKAADLARLMVEIKKVEKDGYGVAIGSRAHMSEGGASGAKAKRSPLRRLTMWGFHTFVSLMVGGSGIKDTQCGFKLFTRASARKLFPVLHIERWAFDVELVFLAARAGMPMVEVPVNWKEMPGSKVDIVSASIQMARDIIVIRMCYMFGIWSDVPPPAPAGYSEAHAAHLARLASPDGPRHRAKNARPHKVHNPDDLAPVAPEAAPAGRRQEEEHAPPAAPEDAGEPAVQLVPEEVVPAAPVHEEGAPHKAGAPEPVAMPEPPAPEVPEDAGAAVEAALHEAPPAFAEAAAPVDPVQPAEA